jgi:hypothetical protein
MSLLQKAIRRSESELAQHAAATLLLIAPDSLWRRCGAAAFEEIGVADLQPVSLVTAALAGKRYRATIGGEWKVASFIVDRMTNAHKCRAAHDLLLISDSHPLYRGARSDLATKTTRELTPRSCFDAFTRGRFHLTKLRRSDAYHKAQTRASKSAAAHCVDHVEDDLVSHECQVLDVSLNGAKLVADIGVAIGSRFRLSAVPDALARQRCEVVWRRGKMFGVRSRMTEAPARVRGTCVTVVMTAEMTAIANVTDNAAKIKRGAITCSLLDHMNCVTPLRSIWFRALLAEIGAVKNVLSPSPHHRRNGSRNACPETVHATIGGTLV